MTANLEEQIKEAERELALRRNFYKKQVARNLMPEELARYRIDLMEAILASLRLLQAPAPELRGCKPLVLYFCTETERTSVVEAISNAWPNLSPRAL